MLSVSFDRIAQNPAEAAPILEDIAGLIREEHYPEALRRLLAIAEFANAHMNPDFIREACFYYFAHLCLRTGQRELFDEFSFLTGPVRSDAALLEYAEHRRKVEELLAHQRAAVAAGLPSILIFSLPKSASALLSNSLADSLGLALVRLDYEDGAIDDSLLRHFALGGCVTHNHLAATARNLSALRRLWNGPVFVQVRDPRAAIWSMYHHVNKRLRKATLEEVVAEHYGSFVAWLDGWFASAGLIDGLEFIRFEEVARDLKGVQRRILSACGAPQSALAAIEAPTDANVSYNFRSGDPDEWRRALAPELQERLRTATPKRVLDFFEG